MKTPLAVETNPRGDIAEADLAMKIEALFAACPDLCGFVVEGLSDLHGDANTHDGENCLMVTQVSLAPPFSREQSQQLCSLIVSVISEIVAEEPQTYALLRDRTFARTLH